MKKIKITALYAALSLCMSLAPMGCSNDVNDDAKTSVEQESADNTVSNGSDGTNNSAESGSNESQSGNVSDGTEDATPSVNRVSNSSVSVSSEASSDVTLSSDTVYGDFTVLATSEKTVTVSKGGYFDLGGGADYKITAEDGSETIKTPSYRAIKFYAWEGDKLTVVTNSNADDRNISLCDGSEVLFTLSSPKSKTTHTFSITKSGYYYLYSPSKGIKVYSVKVEGESITQSNDTVANATEQVVVTPVTSVSQSDFAGSIAESTLTLKASDANGVGMASNLYEIDTSKINDAIYVSSAEDFVSAIKSVKAGGAIVLASGSYSFTSPVKIEYGNNGSSTAYKYIIPATGADVTLDFSEMTLDSSNRGVIVDGNYWHIYGITIKGAGDNGMLLSGNNNIIENVVFRDNRDSGLQVSRYRTDCATIDTWPSNNLILNCTSFNNCDASGENADGFAAKLTCGEGNVFDGCIAYSNSDDGWDLFAKAETGSIGVIILRNCVTFKNGYLLGNTTTGDGDMNGYKLGGHGGGADGCVPTNHKVYNCLAFNNGACGFTDNGNGGALALLNCTSYNSKNGNFTFSRTNGGYFENMVSQGGSGDSFKSGCTKVNYVKDSTSFKSENAIEPSETIHTDYRNADGTVNLGSFLETTNGNGCHFGTKSASVYKVTLTY